MSLRDLFEKLERRARLQGILMILAIALILCSFLQIFSIAVYPYRLLLLLMGTIILALDVYLIMTEEKILMGYGIALERIPKKPRVFRPADIFSTSLRAGLYAVFVIGFFLIGLFYPSFAWASWLIFPSVVSFFCGYLIDNLKKVATIILVGCLISIIIALALYAVPFWEAYRSCFVGLLEYFHLGPITEEETFGCAVLTTASFISLQVPLGFFAAYVGANIKNKE
jgi:hypothetical protein